MGDLLSELFAFSWRGIPFPTGSFEIDVSQDHAEHKFVDHDGAHIEATGRNPITISAKALFRNGITKFGVGEQPGVLYPDRYRKFLSACADRTTGDLVHPELGLIKVKCKSAKTHWDANKRDGVDVDVVWIETTDKADEGLFDRESPAASSAAAAKALDDLIADLPFPEIKRPPPGLKPTTFADLMNSINAVFDQTSLFEKQVAGKVNEVAFRLDNLSQAIDRIKGPQKWPLTQAVEHLRSSIHDLLAQILSGPKQIRVYLVPHDATLAAICVYLNSTITDIINLNQGLFIGPVVARGTKLRYYGDSPTNQLISTLI